MSSRPNQGSNPAVGDKDIDLFLPLRSTTRRGQEAVEAARKAACPPDAIALSPGMSIQAAVEKARPGASFYVMAGIHRLQFIAPKGGQKFFGEPSRRYLRVVPLSFTCLR
jgi:hypothetical protein